MDRFDDLDAHLVAAKEGNAASMFYVAECYADGDQAREDLRLAARWFEKAAKHGLHDGMYEVARCYITGAGVPKDLERAKFWLTRAYTTDHLITAFPKVSSRRRDEVTGLMMSMELEQRT